MELTFRDSNSAINPASLTKTTGGENGNFSLKTGPRDFRQSAKYPAASRPKREACKTAGAVGAFGKACRFKWATCLLNAKTFAHDTAKKQARKAESRLIIV